MLKSERKLHFSMDDVLSSLIEVRDNHILLREHPFSMTYGYHINNSGSK